MFVIFIIKQFYAMTQKVLNTTTQKILNEEQMRKYVEQEVRKALSENTNEGLSSVASGLLGGILGNGLRVPSMEGIIGTVLGNIFITPIIAKLLDSIGIPTDSAIAKFIIETAVSAGGAKLGNWIDDKYDPIGIDNIFRGSTPSS